MIALNVLIRAWEVVILLFVVWVLIVAACERFSRTRRAMRDVRYVEDLAKKGGWTR